jgi:hypothetical protein
MNAQSRLYLAHEYFNRDWLPMPFSKMAQWLAPAKVGFACSADYLSHIDAVSIARNLGSGAAVTCVESTINMEK